MANNTGLEFNPQNGLDNTYGTQSTTVPVVSDDYYRPTPPATPIIPKEEDSEDWMTKYNIWANGLSGLNEEDLRAWEAANSEKIKGQTDAWKDRLWRNQQFVSNFGIDAFRSMNYQQRDKAYEDYLLGNFVNAKYAGNDNLDFLLNLTTEGKKDLLKYGYKSEEELQEENKGLEEQPWYDYSLGERYEAAKTKASSWAYEGMFLGGVAGGVWNGGAGTPLGMVAGFAAGTIGGLFGGAFNPGLASDELSTKNVVDNNNVLSKIVAVDNDRKKAEAATEINDRYSAYIRAYTDGQISSDAIDKLFDNIALNQKKVVTDSLGNTRETNYIGSSYYTMFKDEDEFEHFGTIDKLRYIAQSEVLANKYGVGTALSILEQDMQNYVSDNQSGWLWAGNSLKNVWVGGVANLANKLVGLGALGAYIGWGEEGLANYLNGKDASGNGEDNWIDPRYWEKVDHYNTFDPDAIAKADANGGVSLWNNVIQAGTEGDFWTWNTLNEAVRMNKFAWSDALTNFGLGKVVSRATKLAGGVELAPGVLATESTAASRFINKAGAWGIMASSSLGIDAAYGMQTYSDVLDQNNQRLDKLIAKETEDELQRVLQTPESQAEFQNLVAIENEKRRSNARNGQWTPVDEQKAYLDYTESLRSKIAQEKEALHAEDRQEAMNDAANAYAIDATIEGLRMSTTNAAFKSYLFDKGTLNALRANNPYVGTTFKEGMYALGKHATRNEALKTLGMNIWGGFQSNYFDDITVGYAKAFGIQDYNNYLLQKYNPAAYGTVLDDYVSPYVAGMMGVAEAATDKRSFIDGGIGAIGSAFTFMPSAGIAGGIMRGEAPHREIVRQAEEAAKKGKNISDISGWEIANMYVNNPIIQAVADAKSKTRLTESEINRVNDIIKENGYALNNMVDALTALNRKAIARVGTSVMEAEDAKDYEAFALASDLLSLRNSGVTANAEPDQTTWSRKKKVSSAIATAINQSLGIPLFDTAESPYTRAMQMLEDASTIGETDNAEIQKRQHELVKTFLGLDANKNTLEGINDKTAFAEERLKKNAKGLLDMMNRIEEVQSKFENSIGANRNPDVQKQLLYQYALDDRWQGRLSELEQLITGEKREDNASRHSNPIAKYGSKKGWERALKAQEKRVEEAQKNLDEAKEAVKKESDASLSLKEKTRLNFLARLWESTANEQLKKEQSILKQIETEEKAIDEATSSNTTISAEDILRLNPDDRLRMLDDYYSNDYSEEQRKEIDRAVRILTEDGTPYNVAMERVRDASILNHRIENNMEVAKRIMQNPVEANAMQEALVANRRRNILTYFNDKVVAEAYLDLLNDKEATLSEDNVAKHLDKHTTAVLNGMRKMADSTLKSVKRNNNETDDALDNIVRGIDKVLKKRRENLKETDALDNFLKKTKTVKHTDTVTKEVTATDGTSSTIAEEVTTDKELSVNDKRLMKYAMGYIAERSIPIDKMAETVTTDDFAKYVEERNHTVGVEDRVNPVPDDYIRTLVQDILNDFATNKETVKANNTDKKTSDSPTSVATAPVEAATKKTDGTKDEAVRPDEVDNDDHLGLKKKQQTPEVPEETSDRNKDILEKAMTLNGNILSDINTLLLQVDKMPMEDSTREALKDIIETLVSTKPFSTIKDLQSAVAREAMIKNQSTAPQLSSKAGALEKLDLEESSTRARVSKTDTTGAGVDTSMKLPKMTNTMNTMDLDFFIDNPAFTPQSDYIKTHNIVSFLQKLGDFINPKNKDAKKKDAKEKNGIVFIYDSNLARDAKESMEKADMAYQADSAAPIVMAIEITDVNKHLVENQNQLVMIRDEDNKRTPRYYQPLGFMPANNNTHDDVANTSIRMSALRDRIDFKKEGPQVLRYKPASGKGHGSIIKTYIDNINSHTEEDRRPSSKEGTPMTDALQLLEDNLFSETDAITKSSKEEKEAYKKAKKAGREKETSLFRTLLDAFIDRLAKKKNKDGTRSSMRFKVVKGTRSNFLKDVWTKKISETECRNTPGRSIIDLLKDITSVTSGLHANEVLESNSRIKRLFEGYGKTQQGLSHLTLPKGLFDADGNVVNKRKYEEDLASFSKVVQKLIENNFDVDNMSVETTIGKGKPSEKVVSINIYSTVEGNKELLSTLTLNYNGKINAANYALFIKNLILDENGKVRKGANDSNSERVKWQVNYQDAETANGRAPEGKIVSEQEKTAARTNLKELLRDGIFEIRLTKLAYPTRSVTVVVNNKMKELWADTSKAQPETKAPAPTEQRPAGQVTTADNITVDGDTGAVMTDGVEAPTSTESPKIPLEAQQAIEKILQDSESRSLSQNGSFYEIAGELWSRVTSIKYAMDGMEGRFDPNSPMALPSSAMGNTFDSFGRDVFNGVYDGLSEAELREAFTAYPNTTVSDYIQNFNALKSLQLKLLRNGEVIIPIGDLKNPGHITTRGLLNVTVKGEDGKFTTKQVRVAGTVDVLTVDKFGNFHIYDFKTSHNKLITEEESKKNGYDRQLSMYAKFLEEEYGIKVASINIIPINARYDTARTVDDYKLSNPNSNQLLWKNAKGEYEPYTFGFFKVGEVFPLTRLSDDALTASFDKMTDVEKQAIVEAVQDQSDSPSTEIQSTDEIIDAKPQIEETQKEEGEEGGRSRKGRLGRRNNSAKEHSTTDITNNIDSESESNIKVQIEENKKDCGK